MHKSRSSSAYRCTASGIQHFKLRSTGYFNHFTPNAAKKSSGDSTGAGLGGAGADGARATAPELEGAPPSPAERASISSSSADDAGAALAAAGAGLGEGAASASSSHAASVHPSVAGAGAGADDFADPPLPPSCREAATCRASHVSSSSAGALLLGSATGSLNAAAGGAALAAARVFPLDADGRVLAASAAAGAGAAELLPAGGTVLKSSMSDVTDVAVALNRPAPVIGRGGGKGGDEVLRPHRPRQVRCCLRATRTDV